MVTDHDAHSYDPASYNPVDPAVKPAVEQHFAALRQTCPLHYHKFEGVELTKLNANPFVAGPVSDMYSATKHADVMRILQSDEDFLAIEGAGPERMLPVDGKGMLVWSDGEQHRRSRKVVLPVFAPKNITHLRPRLQTLVDDLIDGFAAKGSADAMGDFGLYVGAGTLCLLVGLPSDRIEDALEWSDALLSTFGGTPEAFERGHRALLQLQEFLDEVTPQRRAALERGEELHDAISALITTPDYNGEYFSPEEVHAAVTQFFGAGLRSSGTAIANGVHLLCTNPDQRELLKRRPELLDTCTEEVLRYMAPIEGPMRTTANEMDFAGAHLPKGQKIRPVLASANMDDEVFEDPFRFRIDRERSELRHHVTLGAGPHSCLGSAIARQQVKISLSTLFRRLPDLDIDPDADAPHRSPLYLVHGYEYVPIRWNPDSVLPASAPAEEPARAHR